MYDEQPLVAVRIKDGIFCGNVTAAYDEDFLIMNKVTHIINCAGGETRDLFKNAGIQYLNFPWSQPASMSSGPNLFDASDKNIETIIRFIDETLAQGECVLVQSVHGRSRSCAIVAAYFIIKYRWTLDHALDFIAMAHEDMEVHPFFRKQLAQFYQKHEIPASQTGRALDIFHPEIDEDGFALDNEQWMLRNTYINGLVNEVQEKTDLYKVAISRVSINEQNPKSAQKRRRRITFCDTKQGTSVACMWTQPVVQPRNATPVIAPPQEFSASIVSRPGTPNTHRLEGESTANVHTATPITALGIPGDPHRANTIKLQLRSSIVASLNKNKNENSNSNNNQNQNISLHRDSPMIGRQGPALTVASSSSLNNSGEYGTATSAAKEENKQQQYNQTVSRILPSREQQQREEYKNNNNYNNNTRSSQQQQQQPIQHEIPRAFNNNNNNSTVRNTTSSQQQQAPSAANIAASLGTTGTGNVITLRGGAPLSVITAGGGASQNNTTSSTQMRAIPDANSGVRPLGGGGGSSSLSNNNNNNNNNNSTTPSRPGPLRSGLSSSSSGVQPGHNRNNPFTLPASGRTAHRGSPLPMQRSSAGSGSTTGSRLLSGTASSQNRTNSPIRNNNIGGGSSGSSGMSPRTNSPLAANRNSTGLSSSSNNNNNSRVSTGSPIRQTNLTSFSNYHTQQRLNAAGSGSSGSGARGSSPIGNRPSSPSRPTASSSNNNNGPSSPTSRSMYGGPSGTGTTSSSGWSSSLLPSSSYASRPTATNPRTGSPIVRSNSPGSQLRTGNNIPSAGSNQISLQNPPSRPASISQQLSSHPSSHIPRQNSPMSFGSSSSNNNPRRTGSPIRNTTSSNAAPFGSSSGLQRTNSPLANRNNAGVGGSLAEQFLYRSSASGGSNNNGRNSPMMRR